MLTQLNNFIIWLDDVVWGIPLIVLILSVGIYLTVRLGLLQIRHLPRALKYMVKNEEGGSGKSPVLVLSVRPFLQRSVPEISLE